MYSTWTIPQLKAELKNRGASLRGRKADLVSRLQLFDRNLNFGLPQQEPEQEDPKMLLPAPEMYHDINSSTILPPVTKQHIQMYFDEFDKKPDKGLQLYESRFLIIIRAAKVDDHTFIKAFGKAAMKRLQYEINLKLHESGAVEESSCECVAGSGITAHCKHVAMALYAVEHMVREKTIIKHLVPTEKLQRFHVPKNVFTSSPLKSAKLPVKRKLESVIFSPCSLDINTDEYNSKIKSLVMNYPNSSMPIKQLYEPANPHAIEWDHAYCGGNEQTVLNSLDLISISKEKVSLIEIETRGQVYSEKWKVQRENRITASKFHTICHLQSKTQEKFAKQMLEQRSFTSRATNHGILNEKVALQQYMEEYNVQVTQCGLFIAQDRPYLGATPDGLLGDDTLIEIKCPFTRRHEKVSDITLPYLIKGNRDGVFHLKHGSPFYYQIQGQLYCTGRLCCNLIIFTFKEMKVVKVERDEEFITGILLLLDQFYFAFFKPAVLNKYLYKNYLETIKRS